MATIQQFQNDLRDKAKRKLIEREIGKDLIQRIESTGGTLKLHTGKDFFGFENVLPELRAELDKKIPGVKRGLLKWQLD